MPTGMLIPIIKNNSNKSECKNIPYEKLITTNGCGSSYQLVKYIRIPKQVSKNFYCACCCHDLQYQEKFTIEEKQEADDYLYENMIYDALIDKKNKLYIKYLCKKIIANITYYFLSTKISEKCFYEAKIKK